MRKIKVNGAEVDEEYLNENIAEALSYEWTQLVHGVTKEHCHCMICGMPIDKKYLGKVFQSKGGHLDEHCWASFVAQQKREI